MGNAILSLAPVLGQVQLNTGSGEVWSISKFLKNAGTSVGFWGSLFIVILGFVALIWAAYQLVTGLMSHGQKQISWPKVIIAAIVGGAFIASGGWTLWTEIIAGGGGQTLIDLGNGASAS